jgi:hypothetical protein
MTRVKSSNVQAIGHDGASLFVQFKNGGVYAYERCPVALHAQGLAADSVGTWLRGKVQGKYPHRKVA